MSDEEFAKWKAYADRLEAVTIALERQVAELQAKAKTANDQVIVTMLTPEQTDRPSIIIGPHQPCHTFTAETGRIDADEPVIVEEKP